MREQKVMTIKFLCLLTLLLVSFGLAEAQPGEVRRIGFLAPTQVPSTFYRVFRERLQELGHVEGKSIVFEFRSGEGRSRPTELATQLVQEKVDVMATSAQWVPPKRSQQRYRLFSPIAVIRSRLALSKALPGPRQLDRHHLAGIRTSG